MTSVFFVHGYGTCQIKCGAAALSPRESFVESLPCRM
jgi:hypothetical protein